MSEIEYKVYIHTDNNKCIRNILSTAFFTEQELKEKGFVYIDEFSVSTDIPTEMHGHYIAENYFDSKFGKSMMDEKYRSNFSYVDSIHELTEEEKEKFFPLVEPQPSELEKLKMRQEVTEQAVQDLILMTMGGE